MTRQGSRKGISSAKREQWNWESGSDARNLVRIGNVSVSWLDVRGGVMLQVALTLMIACIVGLLAYSAYGSIAAALCFSILSALLWLYLIRL